MYAKLVVLNISFIFSQGYLRHKFGSLLAQVGIQDDCQQTQIKYGKVSEKYNQKIQKVDENSFCI